MSDEIEQYEASCPHCGHYPLNCRDCSEITCQEGFIDESEEDYCLPGTVMVECEECKGKGRILWCPACNADLTLHYFPEDEDDINEMYE